MTMEVYAHRARRASLALRGRLFEVERSEQGIRTGGPVLLFDAVIDVGKFLRHGAVDRIGEGQGAYVYIRGFLPQDIGDFADAVGDHGTPRLGVGEGFARATRQVED